MCQRTVLGELNYMAAICITMTLSSLPAIFMAKSVM
jgi:hypothetical protein